MRKAHNGLAVEAGTTIEHRVFPRNLSVTALHGLMPKGDAEYIRMVEELDSFIVDSARRAEQGEPTYSSSICPRAFAGPGRTRVTRRESIFVDDIADLSGKSTELSCWRDNGYYIDQRNESF